ncbi:MAG: anaerobic ribonucleoside-triphosphate reductase activating protein [Clostridia bacterium]|nr:anaerobic ribonucleoside-triphosphate reductase activating protein [Clostridia bacterium]
MKIVGFEKLSLVDFDGYTACTLFTGGCNFRCPFCHNGPLVIGVGLEEYSEEEIFSYLKKRKGILEGVVVTGGEPTLQKDLDVYLKKIKDLGYAVKLDSNGTAPETLRSLIERKLVDYIAMDVKSSPSGYPLATGVPFNENVLKSVDLLLEGMVDYEFRTTLVKGLITDLDVEYMAKWLKGAKKFVFQSFVDREGCLEHGLEKVDKATALRYVEIMEKEGIPARLRNYD